MPLLSPVSGGDGDADAGPVGQHVSSSDPAHRHSFALGSTCLNIFNRLVLEVVGAPFVVKLVKSSGKRAAASSVGGSEGDVVDVASLLQPKKKAKRANPKKKLTGTGTSTGGGSSGQGGEQEGAGTAHSRGGDGHRWGGRIPGRDGGSMMSSHAWHMQLEVTCLRSGHVWLSIYFACFCSESINHGIYLGMRSLHF